MTDLPAAGGGEVLAHTMLGDGPSPRSVVLLHGFLGSGKNLRGLAQRWLQVQPDRRFLLPDLRGHGSSPPLSPDSDLHQLAGDVLSTAATAGLHPPLVLVGHSLGGRVALAAARRAPEQVQRVDLLDITPGPIDPRTSESRQVLDRLLAMPEHTPDRKTMRAQLIGAGVSPGLSDWLLMNLELQDGAYRWRFDRQALDRLHERFTREDLWPVVDAGQVPIRVICGGRSGYVSAGDMARLQSAGCPVVVLPDAGHFVHVDALEPLVATLAAGS